MYIYKLEAYSVTSRVRSLLRSLQQLSLRHRPTYFQRGCNSDRIKTRLERDFVSRVRMQLSRRKYHDYFSVEISESGLSETQNDTSATPRGIAFVSLRNETILPRQGGVSSREREFSSR